MATDSDRWIVIAKCALARVVAPWSQQDRVALIGRAAVVSYVILVIVVSSFHEPWADEAHSWLIARDASTWEMLRDYLRYEGSPALWHLILKAAMAMGMPYEGISYLSASFAIAGVALFVSWSPLPFAARAAVPFTYYFLYQYSVVARNYSVLLLLTTLAIRYYPSGGRIRWRFLLPLILMAWSSVHGAILTLGFVAQFLWSNRTQIRPLLRENFAMLSLYFGAALLLVLVVWPSADLDNGSRPVTDPFVVMVRALLVLAASFFGINVVSGIAACVVIGILVRYGPAAFVLATWVPMSVLFGVRYAAFWHYGIIIFVVIGALSFMYMDGIERLPRHPRIVLFSILAVWMGLQMYQGAASIACDYSTPYCGSKDAASYLKSALHPGDRVWRYGFKSVAVQPYFEKNIFENHTVWNGKAFWAWTTRAKVEQTCDTERMRDARPDWIVLGTDRVLDLNRDESFRCIAAIEEAGYRLVREFKGGMCWQGSIVEENTIIVYRLGRRVQR